MTGEEDKTLLNIFTAMRRDFPRLRDDMLLMIKVIKKLRAQDRWKRRYLGSGSASLFERVRIDPVKKREQSAWSNWAKTLMT